MEWPDWAGGSLLYAYIIFLILSYIHCSFVLEFKVAVNNSVFVPQQNGRVKIV